MSRNFTNSGLPCLLVLACMALVGCASSPELAEGSGAWNAVDEMPPPPRVQRDYDTAIQHMEAGNDAEATQSLEAFIGANPRWAGAYVNLAILYDRNDQSGKAIELLNQAISIDPEFVPAYNQLGVIKRHQGEFMAAEQAWRTATQINPQYAYGWYNLGVLHELYMQDLRGALDHYRRYQDLMGQTEGDPQVARWIADLERRIGKPGQAAATRETS
jgi:tetratricopeptide (TPR) repeat protein